MGKPLEVTLPSGATAKFRDPKTMTRGQRKAAQNEMLALSGKDIGASEAFVVSDLLVTTMVESWSFGFSVSADSLDELPALDSDALMIEASERIPEYWLQVGPTPDPKAPTAPSGGSSGSSAAEAPTSDSPSPLSSPTTSS